jgi:hypothetical protein
VKEDVAGLVNRATQVAGRGPTRLTLVRKIEEASESVLKRYSERSGEIMLLGLSAE